MDVYEFNEVLWNYYNAHGRHDLAWRQPDSDGELDAYKVVVSELMLQQTQVSRVTIKYHEFLTTFPTVQSLANAELADVLKVWSGLGYNRRAKFLWQSARSVVGQNGTFPDTLSGLITLPGIGKNTAGAVLAYAYNKPQPFVETNVRTVFIHHFFNGTSEVADADILAKLGETLDHKHPREYYWALMDYGSHLKQTIGNVSRQSKTYTKQSKFEGSKRQVRGEVLRQLAEQPMTLNELAEVIPDERLKTVLNELLNESLIQQTGHSFSL